MRQTPSHPNLNPTPLNWISTEQFVVIHLVKNTLL